MKILEGAYFIRKPKGTLEEYFGFVMELTFGKKWKLNTTMIQGSSPKSKWSSVKQDDLQGRWNRITTSDYLNATKMIIEKINEKNENVWYSRTYLKNLLLQLKAWKISTLISLNKSDTLVLSETNVNLLINKNNMISSEVQSWIEILSMPFKKFNLSFDHMNFKEHLNEITKLNKFISDSSKHSPSKFLNWTMSKNFNFISTFLLPLCKFYHFQSYGLSLSLLKFWYLLMISPKSRNEHSDFFAHLWEVWEIYYSLAKSSNLMNRNLELCKQFLGKYAEDHDVQINYNGK
jgi:hypothetical protein